MFRRFEVLLVSAFFSPIIYGMNVPMLNRAVSMPQWEKNELTRLVGQYERVGYDPSLPDARMFKQFKNTVNGVQIAKDFVDSCCTTPYDRLDSNLRSPLEAMINNPIGRELVYRTFYQEREALILSSSFWVLLAEVVRWEILTRFIILGVVYVFLFELPPMV